MNTVFQTIRPEALTDNPFTLLAGGLLITGGKAGDFNPMTASWGGLGILWEKRVATVYVRPQRYTREFLDRDDYFTLSFFDEAHKPALGFCGRNSGRDVNKIKETGLTPVVDDSGAVYYTEARLVLVLKKTYVADIDPHNVTDVDMAAMYPDQDYHRMFVGEIVKVLRK